MQLLHTHTLQVPKHSQQNPIWFICVESETDNVCCRRLHRHTATNISQGGKTYEITYVGMVIKATASNVPTDDAA